MQKQTHATPHRQPVPPFPDLAKALSGIRFPQDRKGLIRHAGLNGADEHTLTVIEDMPDYQYKTMADIIAASGNPDAD